MPVFNSSSDRLFCNATSSRTKTHHFMDNLLISKLNFTPCRLNSNPINHQKCRIAINCSIFRVRSKENRKLSQTSSRNLKSPKAPSISNYSRSRKNYWHNSVDMKNKYQSKTPLSIVTSIRLLNWKGPFVCWNKNVQFWNKNPTKYKRKTTEEISTPPSPEIDKYSFCINR